MVPNGNVEKPTGAPYMPGTPAGRAMVPHVEKLEYKCLDVDEDGYLTTLDSDGNKSADLRLPEFAPDAKKVSERIEAYLAAEKDFNVIVLSACGKRQIVDTRFIGEGLVK